MTELGIPLLILFYHPDQPEVKELYRSRVADELKEHRGRCVCVCVCDSYIVCMYVMCFCMLSGWCVI